MNRRFTIEQLEQMKTHDLADLLANVVMLLRRMPDVECRQLTQISSVEEPERVAEAPVSSEVSENNSTPNSATEASLNKMNVVELKKLATTLHISYNSKAKKAELISKILAKQGHEHSEQYAIQNL